MFIPSNKKDKETIHRIHSLNNDVTIAEVKAVFEMLITTVVLDYLDEETTYIPYLGELSIEHESDSLIDGMRDANVKISIKPDNFVKTVIGQIADGEIVNDLDAALIKKIISDMENRIS